MGNQHKRSAHPQSITHISLSNNLLRTTNMLRINSLLLASSLLLANGIASAADLNTTLPSNRKEYDIPAGSLGAALNKLSQKTGKPLVYDPNITKGKNSAALKGVYSPDEAFDKLLQGTGLELVSDRQGNYELRPAPIEDKTLPALGPKSEQLRVDEVLVRGKRFYEVGPLPGLGLTKEEIPGNVQSITAKEIQEAHSLSLAELFNRKLQSVTVNDYQGNPFQMDVTYRGFTAGPQIGTPQGLSVFFDGIRVNEPFGDVVNWDMIPMNAIANIDVFPGSNPVFGLNTLGGAFTVKTKDGFNHTGFNSDVLTGSYGRKQLQGEAGWNNGTVAAYGAANIFIEDGWRDNSPSKVNQVFGKGSYRGDKLDLNLSGLVVWNDLVGNGLTPSEMYTQDRSSVYTSPDTTDNRLWQGQLSGSYFVSESFTITAQAYRRNSKRHQVGADVFTDYDPELKARRRPEAGEQYTCLLASSSTPGVPAYWVIPVQADATGYGDITATQFYTDLSNNYSSDPANDGRYYINPADYVNNQNVALPDELVGLIRQNINWWKNELENLTYNRGVVQPRTNGPDLLDPSGNAVLDGSGNPVYAYSVGVTTFAKRSFNDTPGSNVHADSIDMVYFYTYEDVGGVQTLIRNNVIFASATNNQACFDVRQKEAAIPPSYIDGAGDFGSPGTVKGTPTAILNDNNINQVVDGASIQFNWNLEHHKFMLGASIDSARASYRNTSQLGFLDAEREAYLDPQQAHPQFIGAYQSVSNNNFDGTSTTKSIYFSETWSPVKEWNFNLSGRYNQTNIKNKIAARYGRGAFGIGDLIGYPDNYNVCDGDCTTSTPPVFFRPINLFNTLDKPETEKFSYYSFNPALGATWQATPDLNVFVNFSQGTRTPSVIELGCAFDRTPTLERTADDNGDGIPDRFFYRPRSLVENRQCTLPTALSGDPYLPQIKATTYDIGMRGTLGKSLRWNLGVYQTDLKDDIYFVASGGNSAGFFDTVGDTRRRGFEAGISGSQGKLSFGLNYSLTDATFENNFMLLSQDNSSSYFETGYGNVIQVKKGSRMPGVALHNLNASVAYEITDKWRIGLSGVIHSESFLRGNENNGHQEGAIVPGRNNLGSAANALRHPANNPGFIPGYAVFNLQTSYKISSEWTATMMVNNLFDKEYYSAGRLGRNPFSPSIFGAIGPDGYNHNSDDWRSTNFISPGAPRGIWFSLRYAFDPRK